MATTVLSSAKSHSASSVWSIRLRQKMVKWSSWEYWPIYVVYFFPSIYFLWLCAKNRAWFYFSASNPSIPTGGMFFESKWDILQRMPTGTYAKAIFVRENQDSPELIRALEDAGFSFPVVAKPDRGERGWGVTVIRSEAELKHYRIRYPIDFIIQEFADYPTEWSVFYKRMPNEPHGTITSITEKIYLAVTGDGISTIQDLIIADPRAILQYDVLASLLGEKIQYILPLGERHILVPYGNHCRGALFLDRCFEIDAPLTDIFDRIAIQVEGFYFGRFDLKAQSIEDLRAGRNFSIVELNGCGAEPAHMYQPGYSFWKGQWVIMRHFKWMGEIAAINMKRGALLMTWTDLWEMRAAEKAYRNRVTAL